MCTRGPSRCNRDISGGVGGCGVDPEERTHREVLLNHPSVKETLLMRERLALWLVAVAAAVYLAVFHD